MKTDATYHHTYNVRRSEYNQRKAIRIVYWDVRSKLTNAYIKRRYALTQEINGKQISCEYMSLNKARKIFNNYH